MNSEAKVVEFLSIAPDRTYSAEEVRMIRSALVFGLDAYGQVMQLRASGVTLPDGDPDCVAIGQFATALRLAS